MSDYKEPPRVVQITFTHESLGACMHFEPYMDEAYKEWRAALHESDAKWHAHPTRDYKPMDSLDNYLASNGVLIQVAVPEHPIKSQPTAPYTPPPEMAPFLSYQHELGYSRGVKDVLKGLRAFSQMSMEEREALIAVPPSEQDVKNG